MYFDVLADGSDIAGKLIEPLYLYGIWSTTSVRNHVMIHTEQIRPAKIVCSAED